MHREKVHTLEGGGWNVGLFWEMSRLSQSAYCFSSCVPSQQQLSPVLEYLELQLLERPLCCDHLQLCLNVLLFQGRDANVLDVLFVWQQGRLHDVFQGQILPLQIKLVVCQALGENLHLGIFVLYPVVTSILSQWRVFIALLLMSSRRGQTSLKSSMVFFKAKKAGHSFRAFGSFRHL